MVENVNIGEKVIVLFFSLDEGVLYLMDISESSSFLDGGEGLIDNLHVSLIVVD